jgi:PilZ domain
VSNPPDRRRHLRTEVRRSARLVYGPHGYSVDCIVRDLSDGGARLELASEPMLPREILLVDPTGGTTPARIVWRSGRDIGLQFVSPSRASGQAARPSLLRRLLEAVGRP